MFKNLLKRKSNTKTLDLLTVNKRTAFWKPLLLMLPAIVVLIVFTVIPFITTIDKALHPLTNSHNVGAGSTFGGGEFTKLFHDEFYLKSISNSMLYAIIAIPLIMIISMVISAAIANVVRKKARGSWQTVFFLPYITSAIAVSLAFAYILDAQNGFINHMFGIHVQWLEPDSGIHSYNALWSMLIYGVWKGLAFNILIFTTAMLGVDKTQYKAASIDGAGPIKQFFLITLPSIKKTTSFLLTVGIIGAIKVFPLALYNNDPTAATLNGGGTMMLYIFNEIVNGNFQAAGASSIVLVGFGIAFSIVFRSGIKYAVKGAEKWGERRVSIKVKNTIKI